MANETVLVIKTTPKDLVKETVDEIKIEFEILKKEFQPRQPEELMTRNEVKSFFKVDLSTIHNWTKKGKLKSYGLGHRVYYKRSEIELAIIPLKSTL